ncbi:hypothetical protein ACQE3E_00750 [Methylomonas sp. MED-D]|uniref:hypothetical protein n=1 Tax=unclassified Methylomonas TaxID=2608980 RepID=UPI0028A3B157|nr:hypothetical protein [Methylomonas sp. MV1]MDT4330563.1 hypothetical protein [Methylomonas sp. MV1]
MQTTLSKLFALLGMAFAASHANATTVTYTPPNQVTYTSEVFSPSNTARTFDFEIPEAVIATFIDGVFTISATGDYTIDAANESVNAVVLDSYVPGDDYYLYDWDARPQTGFGTATELGAEGGDISWVRWTRSFDISGDDIVNWTQDGRVVIRLTLSDGVDLDLFNSGLSDQFPPSLQATLTYSVAAVPLPAATWLFTTGLLGVLGVGGRRHLI